jgi:hypothetical protein
VCGLAVAGKMTDSHPHHYWGLPNEPPRRFPRDDPDPAVHGPVRAARVTQAVGADAPTEQGDDRQHVSALDDGTSIAARIEPELRAIVDQAVERVAAVEIEAVREAREQAQELERREGEALEKVLERLARLVDGLDLLGDSVSGMADSMRTEFDAVVAELSRASSALDADAPDGEAPVEDVSGQAAPEPEPDQETATDHETSRTFRKQLENMWRSGTSRDDAERWLMRFELGDRHRDLLDEIYWAGRSAPRHRKGLVGILRGR